MSTWICKATVLGAVLAVAGCVDAPALRGPTPAATRSAPETIAVAGGAVVVGGPPGYCIDRGASRLRGDTGFVLLGSCASIARDVAAGAPLVPGILTASVGAASVAGQPALTDLDQLEALITSPGGRATLARDGRAESVKVFGTLREDGALFVHLRDVSANPTPGLDQTYWRGLFDLQGRLVTLSVVSFSNAPLPPALALATLEDFTARIHRETREQNNGKPAQTTANATPARRKGLLGALFR
ncbi:MAG: hypothetical protein LJE68_02070 [Rhodobacter sp.]|nr:hypothetical protein [Rhodobacter sp.]